MMVSKPLVCTVTTQRLVSSPPPQTAEPSEHIGIQKQVKQKVSVFTPSAQHSCSACLNVACKYFTQRTDPKADLGPGPPPRSKLLRTGFELHKGVPVDLGSRLRRRRGNVTDGAERTDE